MSLKKGNFIWADLSSYNTSKSIAYYTSVFDAEVFDEEGYFLLAKNKSVFAGLYETPPFFKKIKMPHFWMSYFYVPSMSQATTIAKEIGGKVEISDVPFYNGKISLIRDPLGAGFTIYDGQDLQFSKDVQHKSMIKTELHTSDIERVKPFYSEIFGWKYKMIDNATYDVYIDNEQTSIKLRQIPNNLKGSIEYWVLAFKVADIDKVKKRINEEGGRIIEKEDNKLLVSDNSHEAFYYVEYD